MLLLSLLLFSLAGLPTFKCAEIENCEEMSWMQHMLMYLFSPEGAKALEWVERELPRPPKTIQMEFPYFEKSISSRESALFREINDIELSDYESGDDDEACGLHKSMLQDKLVISFEDSDGVFDTNKLNLNKALFEAAVNTINIDRINELLEKKKDLLLSDAQKFKIFKLALNIHQNFPYSEAIYEIFKRLLRREFYKPDKDDRECLFYDVFKSPRLIHVFLDYDPQFFAKDTKCNYVKQAICLSDYEVAANALGAGNNPKIEIEGRNALDEALANLEREKVSKGVRTNFKILPSTIKQCSKLESQRNAIIHNLRNVYFVKETVGFKNFVYCCLEKRFDYATRLLKTGHVPSNETFTIRMETFKSPLDVALFSKNLDLICNVYEYYFSGLNLEQVQNCLRFIEFQRNDTPELIKALKFIESRLKSKLNIFTVETEKVIN